ncbi:metal-sulfur cluster assembly factor [Staphylococcus aureus]
MEEALKDSILGALEMVIDPELGIDIVNLGLVYKVNVDDEGVCTVDMTLTSMGCPCADLKLLIKLKTVLAEIPEIQDTEVNIVWSPPWTKDMMSRYAKIALGVS